DVGFDIAQKQREFDEKYAEARRQADAAEAVAKGSRRLSDEEDNWGKVADSVEARKGFDDAAQKSNDEILGGISDLRTRTYVKQRLDTEALNRSESVRRESFGHEAAAARGKLTTQLATFAQQAAVGTTPEARALATDNAMAAIHGSVAAGWTTPEA